MELELVTLASIPAIIALVTLAKDLGLPSKLSPLLAVLLGIVGALVNGYVLGTLIDGPSIVQVGVSGIILGLGAAGLYDGAKAVGARREPIILENVDGIYQPRHAEDTPPAQQ